MLTCCLDSGWNNKQCYTNFTIHVNFQIGKVFANESTYISAQLRDVRCADFFYINCFMLLHFAVSAFKLKLSIIAKFSIVSLC